MLVRRRLALLLTGASRRGGRWGQGPFEISEKLTLTLPASGLSIRDSVTSPPADLLERESFDDRQTRGPPGRDD
jgi:hypothetical protein